MTRTALPLGSLVLINVGCTPCGPSPAVPDAGCRVARFGSGSAYYTCEDPTPWDRHKFFAYNLVWCPDTGVVPGQFVLAGLDWSPHNAQSQ